MRVAMGLLRGHVLWRADDGDCLGAFGQPGNAKIGQVSCAVAVEEDVGRFQVAVDDVVGVGFVQGGGDALGDGDDLFQRQRPLRQAVLQRTAVHQAHDDVGPGVFLAVVVHRHNGVVLQVGDDFGFAFKSLAEVGLLQEAGWQHFQGDFALEAGIVGYVNCPHAPLA